jgi:hypothetical protein
MSTPIRAIALTGALVAAVLGGALLLTGGGAAPPPAPTPTPSPSPTPPPLSSGRLEHRDYVARAFTGDHMAFIITVPDGGWSGFGEFFLAGPRGAGYPSGVAISFNHDAQVVADPCAGGVAPTPPIDPTIDNLVAALSAREDLEVSGVTDAELAGYRGTRLDIQLLAMRECTQQYVFAEPQGLYSNGSGNRWRVWLLDVGGSTAGVVLLDYEGTAPEDRAAAEAAIDSLRIEP